MSRHRGRAGEVRLFGASVFTAARGERPYRGTKAFPSGQGLGYSSLFVRAALSLLPRQTPTRFTDGLSES